MTNTFTPLERAFFETVKGYGVCPCEHREWMRQATTVFAGQLAKDHTFAQVQELVYCGAENSKDYGLSVSMADAALHGIEFADGALWLA